MPVPTPAKPGDRAYWLATLLPVGLLVGRVRSALTAVSRRTLEPKGTFDANGWLQIGLCGHQPSIDEGYSFTGSLYLCTTALLPLGLPTTDAVWTALAQNRTSRKIWLGQDVKTDHAL